MLTSDTAFLEGILFLFFGVRCLSYHQMAVTPEDSSLLCGCVVQGCVGTLPVLLGIGWRCPLWSRSVLSQEMPSFGCHPSLTLYPLSQMLVIFMVVRPHLKMSFVGTYSPLDCETRKYFLS